MGKTTVAAMFIRQNVPVLCADEVSFGRSMSSAVAFHCSYDLHAYRLYTKHMLQEEQQWSPWAKLFLAVLWMVVGASLPATYCKPTGGHQLIFALVSSCQQTSPQPAHHGRQGRPSFSGLNIRMLNQTG